MLALFRTLGAAGLIVLKFGVWLWIGLLCISSMLGMGYYVCAHVRTSFSYLGILRTHHAKIWCLFRPINYALYIGYASRISASAQVKMNILFKHILFVSAGSSPKRRLTGFIFAGSCDGRWLLKVEIMQSLLPLPVINK